MLIAEKAYARPDPPELRRRGIAHAIPERADQVARRAAKAATADAHRTSTSRSTGSETSWNAASTG